jgi:hypothetical protein
VTVLSMLTFAVHQKHFQFLDAVDQDFWKSLGGMCCVFFLHLTTNVKHQDLILESSPHPVINACAVNT